MMKINTDYKRRPWKRKPEVLRRGSNIAKHASSSNHSIDFKNSKVIDDGSSHIRKTQES